MPMNIAITLFLSATLTPLIIMLWGKLSPAKKVGLGELTFQQLTKRNRIINGIATLLCLTGIMLPFPLMKYVPETVHGWVACLGFGLMIILPFIFISIVTLPKGLSRFYEFWRYYELNYKIGIKGIMVAYIPIMILGFYSIYEINKSI